MAPIKNTNRGFIGSFVSRIGISTSIFVRPNFEFTRIVTSVDAPGWGVRTVSPYTYRTFAQPGRFYVSNAGYVDFFVVAGGGAGGGGGLPLPGTGTIYYGGGGGGGGIVQRFNVLCPVGFYSVCTGVGGATPLSPFAINPNCDGTPSFVSGPVGFTTITAIGGGAGGTASWQNTGVGRNGGCGGGGGGTATAGGPAAPGFVTSAGVGTGSGLLTQGYPGGQGGALLSGSGGGAGFAGKNANYDAPTSVTNGADGIAAFNGDIYVSNLYGSGPATPTGARYFGGGGGGVPLYGGGSGGGAAGGPATGSGSGCFMFSGGGGGGGGSPPAGGAQGGMGGPGIVIIRYRTSSTLSF